MRNLLASLFVIFILLLTARRVLLSPSGGIVYIRSFGPE